MGFARLLLTTLVLAGLGSARRFEGTDPISGQPCVLLDISFNIEVTALKDDQVVAVRNLTPDDKGTYAQGVCSDTINELAIFYGKKSLWAIAFQPHDSYPVAMYRSFLFRPEEIFGSAVNITDEVGFSDPRPVYLKDASHSFMCSVTDEASYVTYTPASVYNFTVSVSVYDIHTQGMGLTGRQYGPEEVCTSPVIDPSPGPATLQTASPPHPITHVKPSTSPVTPVTHVQPVTPVTHVKPSTSPVTPVTHVQPVTPVTHFAPTQVPVPPPKAPTNSYSVQDGNVTCISMETALTIVIEYPLTTPKKYKTATVNVPEDARATGNCRASESTQELSITFFNGWELKFTFSKDKASKLNTALTSITNNPPTPSYRISNITLLVVVDDRIFPDSLLAEGSRYTDVPSSKSPDFAQKKSTSSNFFKCTSSDVNELKKGVEVKTSHLKFKAFNTDGTASFDGKPSECSGDHHATSKGGLIAGIVIAIVVVAAVVALVAVMVTRRKKAQYDSIQ